jgi:NAD(P)-dependent dehydrogenase (short-subunit alcohol dehydrogenase family)
VVAPGSSVGVAGANEGLLQVLVGRLIQEDKVVVVATQRKDEQAELER